MKTIRLIQVTLALITMMVACQSFAAEVYKFDPDHTVITWSVSHFGFSKVSGKMIANGELKYDEKNPSKSSVELTVPVKSNVTGIEKFDRTLQRKSFFDAETYPDIKFVSTKIDVTGKETGKVYGNLTVKGITKPIVLDVKLNKQGVHPFFGRKALGFTATTMLKRSEFNMKAYLPGVSDEVTVDIEAEAIEEKKD